LSITYSVLSISIIIAAYFVANGLLPAFNPVTRLDTIVYHVCENEEVGNVTMHVPNVAAVYQQILAANNGKYPNVLLFPTYAGNWDDEFAWLRDNFGGVNGIPIMFEVFCPGDNNFFKLTPEQISAVIDVCNVKWLRFAEVISFSLNETQNFPFPTEYVSNILSFCRDHNLRLFWTEWKVDHPGVQTFQAIKNYIKGFEDIVTVSFSTNSGEMEPAEGFAYMNSLFPHWGGSVQSWYYETRLRSRLENYSGPVIEEESRNMPISLLLNHALLCRKMGAEVIQFEPYWYFFGDTDGKARESLNLIHYYLNME
jgi:hypothetical protein